jgi:hypothetical protein
LRGRSRKCYVNSLNEEQRRMTRTDVPVSVAIPID